jgi:RNA polymerase sigma-70 factor (ECF subfamily)
MSAAMSVSGIDTDQETTGSRDPMDVAPWFDDALPRLFGYFIARVGGRVAVAEDLTQETMLAAVRSASGPDDADAVMPWLYGIARHKLMDHYRRLDRERRHFGRPGDPDDDLAAAPALPDLDLDALHVRDAIIATLDKLPPRQRGALVLRYVDGCDVPTTAALLDTTVHAAESLLARARASFRHHYHALTGEES